MCDCHFSDQGKDADQGFEEEKKEIQQTWPLDVKDEDLKLTGGPELLTAKSNKPGIWIMILRTVITTFGESGGLQFNPKTHNDEIVSHILTVVSLLITGEQQLVQKPLKTDLSSPISVHMRKVMDKELERFFGSLEERPSNRTKRSMKRLLLSKLTDISGDAPLDFESLSRQEKDKIMDHVMKVATGELTTDSSSEAPPNTSIIAEVRAIFYMHFWGKTDILEHKVGWETTYFGCRLIFYPF